MLARRNLLHLTLLTFSALVAGCGTPEPAAGPGDSHAPGNTPESAANAPGNAPADSHASTPTDGKPVGVVMETSMGTIELELYPDKAPITVENFVKYVKKGHYAGTVFHRVIPGFMIQGGGFTPDMTEKPTDAPIKNEGGNGLKNDRGTVAMARTPDPDSASAQFFINVANNDSLNREQSQDGAGYAVFGKVTKGMDVADKIVGVPTGVKPGPGGMPMENVPQEPVTIKSVKLKEGAGS
jgi:peptidyl-prolyl cis-trans isomerase A (cyclophilin A)